MTFDLNIWQGDSIHIKVQGHRKQNAAKQVDATSSLGFSVVRFFDEIS